ncbi:putative ECF RNA polymerase sigma factor SigI [Streptomyces sp. enrichment culture]|uniref:RNA polymerase subunit sigma n=1 Tax=Streptomyces sp. enrichment culture TaxID=1795815 RepID=UPI003F571213
MDGADDVVPIAELLDERRYLLDVAFWMLGSGSAAESVVDEAYRRWYGLSGPARAAVVSPRSWLAEATGGICLGRLTLPGRREREDRAGGEAGPVEEVGEVLLEVLDCLPPAERAVFVLNDVFRTAPGAVAGVVGRAEPECVEPADRARRSLRARRARPVSPRQHDAVVRAVRQACADEDMVLLTSLLASDATVFFDGGGRVRAPVRPVHGRARVARSLLTVLARRPRTALHTRSVNGRTGLVVRYGHRVAAVVSLDIAGHRVAQLWVTLNPDKLRSWNG